MSKEIIEAHMEPWAWCGMNRVKDTIVVECFQRPDNLNQVNMDGLFIPYDKETDIKLIHGEDSILCKLDSVTFNMCKEPARFYIVVEPIEVNRIEPFIHNVLLEAFGQPRSAGNIIYDTIERMDYD